MRIETKVRLVIYAIAAAFVFATFGRLFAATPVIVGEDRVPVHSNCLLIYSKSKMYRCDRIFSNGF